MDKDKLADVLFEYFGFNDSKGTSIYTLTRNKDIYVESDDFQEIDEEFICDLTDYLYDQLNKL